MSWSWATHDGSMSATLLKFNKYNNQIGFDNNIYNNKFKSKGKVRAIMIKPFPKM